METQRFDQIARLLAARKLSRRRALARGSAGLAAGALAAAGVPAAAQQTTPTTTGTADKVEFLFVQSFQSGSIAPREGAGGAFTLTLAHGLGRTVYFSDRPARVVGTAPTAQFLETFPFGAENPPNAALVVEAAGASQVAVVELTNPRYEAASHTATYDATLLKDAQELGITVAGAREANGLPARFGAASLFIDDCPDQAVACYAPPQCEGFCPPSVFVGNLPGPDQGGLWPFCYQFPCCEPCFDSWQQLDARCNAAFPAACDGHCEAARTGGCVT